MNFINRNKIKLLNNHHFSLLELAYYAEEVAKFKPKMHTFLFLYRFAHSGAIILSLPHFESWWEHVTNLSLWNAVEVMFG